MTEPPKGIGAVVEELRTEFPDVSVSKLRYLESRRLIAPARTPRGTRRFDRESVERTKEVLRLQRDEFLPLDVIARRMESWLPSTTAPAPPGPLGTAELASAAGIDVTTVDALTAHGLLRPDNGTFSPASLVIARGAAELLAAGLEPRHLRLLRSGVEQVSERVAATTRAVAKGRSGEATRREMTDRLEQAVRLVLDGVAQEEFGRLRTD